ncbi:hypothetical protein N9N67_05795 [Bacteriovoracaceae bacterium]|nr:hypothetical protein [Bacteriovoracaceae bacterium]
MKLFFLTSIILANLTFAQVGFQCKKDKRMIERGIAEGIETLIVKSQNEEDLYNLRIDLVSKDDRGYQHRYGYYNQIAVYALERFPYMPEILLLFHMSKANKAYQKGFKVFEKSSAKPIVLKQMYCDAFIKALLEF